LFPERVDLTVLHTTVQQLTKLEAIKTWSLVVTLLGDMSQPQISGKQMGLLLGHVGLKPEAIRVAMHRLKKDGWITSSKNGREVLYSLSKQGVDATELVYSDVYRTDLKYPNGWNLYLVESDDAFEERGPEIIRLLKRLYLVPNGHEAECSSALHIAVQNNNIPIWLVERLIPVDVLAIAKQLNKLALDIINAHSIDPIQTAVATVDDSALRLLFLHRWRKMALRENTWAHISLFPEGDIAQCQRHVTQLLAKWPRINPNWPS